MATQAYSSSPSSLASVSNSTSLNSYALSTSSSLSPNMFSSSSSSSTHSERSFNSSPPTLNNKKPNLRSNLNRYNKCVYYHFEKNVWVTQRYKVMSPDLQVVGSNPTSLTKLPSQMSFTRIFMWVWGRFDRLKINAPTTIIKYQICYYSFINYLYH